MQIVRTIAQTREAVAHARARAESVGLVPTMGALHEGHRSLVRTARQRCGYVAVSIFVNPTQFGPEEDLEAYPRTFEADRSACQADGADLIFAPAVKEMYPGPGLTTVHVADLTAGLCGASRPVHFDGVTTVVAKLFNIVGPDVAFFGEKDYQQLAVIRRMVLDLDMPVEVIGCPTIREPDGLALSSRNEYLDVDQRRQAPVLHAAMQRAAQAALAGRRNVAELIAGIEGDIRESGPAEIDYVKIVDAETLDELPEIDRPARICLAVKMGKCRLIDNLAVDAPQSDR